MNTWEQRTAVMIDPKNIKSEFKSGFGTMGHRKMLVICDK